LFQHDSNDFTSPIFIENKTKQIIKHNSQSTQC
jgi:hypothetical protein